MVAEQQSREVPYTVCVPETRTREVQVCRMVAEQQSREVQYTTCHAEQRTATRQVTTCKMVPEEKTATTRFVSPTPCRNKSRCRFARWCLRPSSAGCRVGAVTVAASEPGLRRDRDQQVRADCRLLGDFNRQGKYWLAADVQLSKRSCFSDARFAHRAYLPLLPSQSRRSFSSLWKS